MLKIRRISDESMNGAVAVNDMTDSPNGADSATAVTKPATAVDRIRIGPLHPPLPPEPGWRAAQPPTRTRRRATGPRRIVTAATIGTRIASWGFTRAATTAKIAARSLRAFHSSRTDSSRNTVPKLSTWPQMTESNQVIGLSTTTAAAMRRPSLADPEVARHQVDDQPERRRP